MNLRRVAGIAFLGLLAIFTAGSRLRAQALYGSIVGVVTDSSGAVVPGATVKTTQTGTGQVRQTVTGQAGSYSFPTLPQGTYDVAVSHAGFESFVERGVSVTNDGVVRVDAALTVGTATETVQVASQTAELQTDTADVRSEISTKELQEVPIPVNRNYQNLLVMVPGI